MGNRSSSQRCGRNNTHISNAYSKSDRVWALFSSNELTPEALSVSISALEKEAASGTANASNLKNNEVKEVVPVPFDKSYVRRREAKEEYVTILAEEGKGNFTVLCPKIKILHNRSIIVTDDGECQPQNHGKDLWEDWTGRNHKPPYK